MYDYCCNITICAIIERPKAEQWMMNMTELAKVAKLICLITERSTTIFISNWKPLMDIFLKKDKNEVVIDEFGDLKG